MGWDDSQFLQSNITPAYGCVHSNPYFGDMASGESVVRRGRIAVVEGGPEEAHQDFLEYFGG